MRARRNQQGFTLIELLIVVAIIGLLVAIAIPALQYALDRSKQRVTLADLRQVAGAIMQYNLDTSIYPNNTVTVQELVVILEPFSGRNLPTQDRWANDLGYTTDGSHYYSLESFGRDGIDGANIDYITRNDFNLDMIHANGSFAAGPE